MSIFKNSFVCPFILFLIFANELGLATIQSSNCTALRATTGIALTKVEKINFENNFALMGVNKFNELDFGSVNHWESLLFYAIRIKASENLGASELFSIYTSPHKNLKQLKSNLDNWARKNAQGFEFIFRDEIEQYGNGLVEQGIINRPKRIIQAENGYVIAPVYSRLVLKKKLPIIDPHDALLHVMSLLEPEFMKSFIRYVELIKVMEGRVISSGDITSSMNLRSWSPSIRANTNLLLFLDMTVRDMAHENWTYIVRDNAGNPQFFMQGNAPFNGYMSIRVRNIEGFASQMLNFSGGQKDRQYYRIKDSLSHLRSLEGVEEFVAEKSSRKKQFADLEKLFSESSLSEVSYQRLSSKLLKFVETESLMKIGKGAEMTPEEVEYVIFKIASFVDSDAELKAVFDKENLEILYDKTIAFIIDYKEWMDHRYGIPF